MKVFALFHIFQVQNVIYAICMSKKRFVTDLELEYTLALNTPKYKR